MLVFTSLDGARVEPCLIYSEYEKLEELNGSLQISFIVPEVADNAAAFSILDYETTVEDEDGHLYVVKQIKGTHTQKIVTAIHKYFSLSDVYFHDQIGGSITVENFVQRLLSGTGFTPTLAPSLASRTITITNFGNDYVSALVDKACEVIGMERQITSGSTIHFAEQIGQESETIFQYADNIKTLSYEVDTTDVKTKITGISEKIPGATVYESPNAAVFGIREAAPIEDNNIENTADMVARLRSELSDEPEVAITLDVLTLDANIGDSVLLLHEPLGLDVYTRVMAKTTYRNYEVSNITIGNTRLRTLGDVIADQGEKIKTNEDYTRSRFEQTRDRITLEVENVGKSIASLEIRADSIVTSVADLAKQTDSKITQMADSIRLEVAGKVTEITNTTNELGGRITTTTNNLAALQITANNISSTVSSHTTSISNLGTRVYNAESTITQHANSIEARVKTTDYTGATLISKINLEAGSATIQARKINLVGAVSVLSDITGNLGSITAGNIYGANIDITSDIKLGNRLYLNGGYGAGLYFDRFGGTGKIYTNGNNMVLFSDAMQLSTLYGLDIYSGLRVDGEDVVTTRNSGLGFGYSSSSKRLYVSMNGYDVGYVNLT